MTCIVGLEQDGAVWLGGDAAAVGDSHYMDQRAEPKVFTRDGYILGFSSSFRMGQLLQYTLPLGSLVRPTDPVELDRFMATTFVDAVRSTMKAGGYARTKDGEEAGGIFLVGVRGRLYVCDVDFHVGRSVHGFASVGSGCSVALGAMHASDGLPPQSRISGALAAAETFVATVRAPFTVEVLDAA